MRLSVNASGLAGTLDLVADDMPTIGTESTITPFPDAFGTGTIRRFTLNTSLFITIVQCTLNQVIRLRRQAQPSNQHIITFSFRNLIRPVVRQPADGLPNYQATYPLRSVQVSSSDINLDFSFPAHAQINTIIIGIHVATLTQLIGPQTSHPLVQALLIRHQSYLYEQIGSLAMEQIATELIAQKTTAPFPTFYLTLQAQALIYQFLLELMKREAKPVYPLGDTVVKALYIVRDQLVTTLSKPPNIAELARMAAMSESKLRRLFSQVFGMSPYEYYQTVRMHEAAQLLRESGASVSEVGYQLGFTNLSHFTRIFEKHQGQKPKQYAKSGERTTGFL